MNRRKKVAGLFWLPVLLFALMLTGCGKTGGVQGDNENGQGADAGTNVVEIKKDGVISNTTEEDFGAEDYGDEEMLREFVLRTAAECNIQLGGEEIAVKKLEVKKERVTLVMEYSTGEAFSVFNGYPFFYGTVAEAYEKGYDLDVELQEAGGSGEGGASIGKDQLLEMGSRSIIITQPLPKEYLTIRTSGKILYISGAECIKNNEAKIGTIEEGSSREIAYIVFK